MSNDELEETYDGQTSGKAVFFSPHPTKSFYFEPSDLEWNFSHYDGNPDGGSVLDGTFNYNKEFFDQTPDDPIGADFLAQSKRGGPTDSRYALITFYAPHARNRLVGRFRASDPENVLADFRGEGVHLSGEWKFVHSDSLEDRLRKKYEGRETEANTLFFKSTACLPAFHLVAKELDWEFLYGVDPPQDPGLPGILFYNEGFFDKEVSHPIKADFLVEQKKEKSRRYVLIKFYNPDAKDDESLLGEFLAADPNNESKELLDKRDSGYWSPLPGPDLWKELREKYEKESVSDALLYKCGSAWPPFKSFRFEVYQRGWEFGDHTFVIGHRLAGSIFFTDPLFQDGSESFRASYRIERRRGNDGYYALVKFYAPRSDVELWGESLAFDPDNIAGRSGLLNRLFRGEWRQVNYISLNATASKEHFSTRIKLSLPEDVGKMQCKRKDKIFRDAFDVRGLLISKRLSKDGNYGHFVRWYKDRAVFYEDDTAEDFTAYFFPDPPQQTIGPQDDLEMDVSWEVLEPEA